MFLVGALLHGLELSGNCDKIRLFRSLLGLRNSRALFSFPAGSVWPVGEPPAARSSIRRFLMRASIAAMAASVGGALFLTAIRVGLVYVPYLLLLQ